VLHHKDFDVDYVDTNMKTRLMAAVEELEGELQIIYLNEDGDGP
jgi:hypothetical protein